MSWMRVFMQMLLKKVPTYVPKVVPTSLGRGAIVGGSSVHEESPTYRRTKPLNSSEYVLPKKCQRGDC